MSGISENSISKNSISRVEGSNPSLSSQPSAIMTNQEAFSLLGTMRDTIHKKATEIEQLVPRYSGQQRIVTCLFAGGLMAGINPALAVGVIGLGMATAILEAAFTSGVKVTAGMVAHLTRPPDQ